MAPPGADCIAGRNDDTGTSFFPGEANDGGRWYPAPPCPEFRKNESHD